MFTDSLNYPRTGTAAVKTILVGGLLTLFGFLLLPMIAVVGYTVRVVRSVVTAEEEPPVFDDWRGLLVDGLEGFVVGLVYFVLPMVILAGSAFLAAGGRGGGAVAMVIILLAGVVSLVCWYVGTAGFVNFAVTGRLTAAFAFEDLRPVLASGSFATAWALALGVLFLSGLVTGILGLVPVVGAVVGAFVTFYATVSVTYLYARGFAEATSVDVAPEAPMGQPAA